MKDKDEKLYCCNCEKYFCEDVKENEDIGVSTIETKPQINKPINVDENNIKKDLINSLYSKLTYYTEELNKNGNNNDLELFKMINECINTIQNVQNFL